MEKITKKLIKAQCDINFLRMCLIHDLKPKFVRFKLSNKKLNTTNKVKKFQRQLLLSEYIEKQKQVKKLTKELEIMKNKGFFNTFDIYYRTKLKTYFYNLERFETARIKGNHEIKLSKLLGAVCDHTQSSLLDINKLVYNLSSKELTIGQKTLLSRGWKFCIEQRISDPLNLQTEIEYNMHILKKQIEEKKLDWRNIQNQIKIAANEFINKVKTKYISNLSKEEQEAIKELKEDRSIVILRADKGNAIVIMNKIDYMNKVKELLNDQDKFISIKEDESASDESIINRRLMKLKKDKKITIKEYNHLVTSGSSIPVLYCTVKVHKRNFPLRPIVSMCNAPNYKLAGYLANMLNECRDKSASYIKDSFQFAENIKKMNIHQDEIMVSFDVQSLYPNVPVEEAIKIAVELIWKKNKEKKFTKITKNELFILFNLAVRNVHFRFFHQYYRQSDGVAMGSPLAPILADLFMSQLEEEKISLLTKGKIKIWIRYVDDVFAIAKGTKEDVLEILEKINKIHNNIKFTIEFEQENMIPFLDVNIKREGNTLETSLYRKITNTNLYLKWDACLPRYQKLGLISSLVIRACRICSSDTILNNELEYIKKVLNQNGYPKHVIDKRIKNAICKEKEKQRMKQNNIATNNTTCDNKEEKTSITLSYTGHESFIFSRKLMRIFRTTKINTKIIFKKYKTIGQQFREKMKGKNLKKIGVIYCIECKDCEKIYIGQTGKEIEIRMKQHEEKYRLGDDQSSTLVEHAKKMNHRFNFEEPNVLAYDSNERKREIKETLFTKKFTHWALNEISFNNNIF
jgi:hypothetical protein